MVNLMRGSSKNPSIINIQKCGALDWTLYFGTIAFYTFVFYLNTGKIQKQEAIKKEANIGVYKDDI